jgi:hypothetical protein
MTRVSGSLIALLLVEEIATLALFFALSRSDNREQLVPILLIIGAVLILATLFSAVRGSTLGGVLVLSILNGVALVAAIQVMAFWVFPGIMKDIEPLTAQHIRLATLQFAALSVGTLLVGSVLSLLQKR